MNSPNEQRQRGYPLITLFVLIGTCAVLAGMFAAAVRALTESYVSVSTDKVVRSCSIASAISGAVGLCLGLLHHRRLRGMLLGIVTGFLIGAWIGVIVLVPWRLADEVWGIGLGSSLVAFLVLIVARYREPFVRRWRQFFRDEL